MQGGEQDVITTIVHGKDWGIKEKRSDWGSQYTFLSVDVESRLIMSNFNMVPQHFENAVAFFKTLKQRVPNRFQLNTDAWTGYSGRAKNSIKTVFGKEIDHATEEKEYYKLNQFVTRHLARTKRKSRAGNPDLELGSTSRVERTVESAPV